ncbi:hypothetical protein LPTSP4_23930 [Leptospira ryugenii]|uniref:Calcineurin-like phosphoesterase domain-containing protein n=1 Tax=Leptospira ryugenii TaxID=1917863 RepID=A0A2P2E231_9LEPT|nr:metallophosphoesterase [Leptospira ryugenii]GBF50866.1 hypothetical protein LPTSP4_23930 [Leptospira ryugenii]
MKFLQFSDLHISEAEKAYSFQILDELLNIANTESVDALFLCGDIFDTYSDFVALRHEFVKKMESASAEVFFLPGNHEGLRRPDKHTRYQMFDWGKKIRLLDEEPYHFIYLNEKIEIFGIPHSQSYTQLLNISIPEKKAKWRIGLAHATVLNMSYTGPKEEVEEGGGLLDPALFQKLNMDFVAIGHIHSSRSQSFGKLEVCYAGSSRVWRKGEFGARFCVLIQVNEQGISKKYLPIQSAGQFYELNIELDLNGKAKSEADLNLDQYGKSDYLLVHWNGVVESNQEKQNYEIALKSKYKDRIRLLEFDDQKVKTVPDISENVAIRQFIQIIDQKKEELGSSWALTKQLGIELLLNEVTK